MTLKLNNRTDNDTLFMKTKTHSASLKGGLLFSCILALLIVSIICAFLGSSLFAWLAGLAYIIYDTFLLMYVTWKTRHIDRKRIITNNKAATKDNSIGVLVPIHNESSGIIPTIERLLKQNQPLKKIIIIDDGSTDDSLAKLKQTYGFAAQKDRFEQSPSQANVFLLAKDNSGKSDSLNNALQYADCDIVISVDADTLLEPHAIAETKAVFDHDNNVMMAGGILTPKASGKLMAKTLTAFQHFEYALSYLSRAAWGETNALLLVSGAFAAYRKEALIKIGGYDTNSLVEDYELTHRMHKYSNEQQLNWKITTLGGAQGITDAPATIRSFIQQRKRWFAGFLRTHYQYRQMIASKQYQQVGKFMLPIKTIDTLQPIYGLIAFISLLVFIFTDPVIASSVLIAILIKLGIDFAYHIWALRKYYQWINQKTSALLWLQMIICCLTGPILFQPLRHLAALIGWSQAMNKNTKWQPIRTKHSTI